MHSGEPEPGAELWLVALSPAVPLSIVVTAPEEGSGSRTGCAPGWGKGWLCMWDSPEYL